MSKLAIFVSGGGTNCENIILRFREFGSEAPEVEGVYSDKSDCGAFAKARALGVPTHHFALEALYNGELLHELQVRGVKWIVLAGYLRRIPAEMIAAYPRRIINIHPALLPKYGGKGMYGHHVHEAVVAAHERESGISIHFVNEELDRGDIIFQAKCELAPEDTPEQVFEKVHALELRHFPKVIMGVVAVGELGERD